MPFFDQYPYTNFHNVNLDWVLERVKEWGALVEQNNTAFHDLEEANEDFKNYVTGYLENLDIQAQINDKLDRMFKSGELTDYLQPYVSTTVTTWLDENITEPTGVVIDASLTVAGACADAKAVGDRLRLLNPDLLTSDIKQALLNCFRTQIWSNDSLTRYLELEEALFNDPFYNTYVWNMGVNCSVINGGIDANSAVSPTRIILSATNSPNYNKRRTLVTSKGKAIIYRMNLAGDGVIATNYYPIPIPLQADTIKITMSPSGQDIYFHTVPYNPITNAYYNSLEANRQGWTTLTNGTFTKNIVQSSDGKQLFLVLNFRYNSTATDYPTPPTNVRIEFS